MWEYCDDKLGMLADRIYPEFMTYKVYEHRLARGTQAKPKFILLQKGGNGRKAIVAWDCIDQELKSKIAAVYGDPKVSTLIKNFTDKIERDVEAYLFYKEYELANGDNLPVAAVNKYTMNATILNTMHKVATDRINMRKSKGGDIRDVWPTLMKILVQLPAEYNHDLPLNIKRIKSKLKDYLKDGYESLIHKNYCNINSVKLQADAQLWILSRWANRVNVCPSIAILHQEYSEMILQHGWPALETDRPIRNYLMRPDIKAMWYGARYGDAVGKEKYNYQQKTIMPSMRDSLWYSDGTKLNYMYQYQTKDGKTQVGTCKVYEIMDAYSEVLLGYEISDSEDFVTQYRAYKMAVMFSGHRPYEIRFDNQGGHKKLTTGDFMTKISHLAIRTQPYNGKSKTIENAFYRFQSQFMKRDWFFTGQNITTKKLESKADHELLVHNKMNLPTREEVMAKYKKRREQWNHADHPTSGKSRIDTYLSSTNDKTPKVEMWDMVDMFWIERAKTVKMTSYGLTFTEKKEDYTYIVNDLNGIPDMQWLTEHIDVNFVVKFDPDHMSTVMLYVDGSTGLKFVKEAVTKVEMHRNIQEQEDGERATYEVIETAKTNERVRLNNKLTGILESFGATPEQQGLRSPGLLGLKSRKRKLAKAEKNDMTIGAVHKNLSNMDIDFDAVDDTDYEMEIYKMM
jgi:hypothetical protein